MKKRNNRTSKIAGQGDVHIVTSIGYKLMLKNLKYILDLRVRLLSTGMIYFIFLTRCFEVSERFVGNCKGEEVCCSLYKNELRLVQGKANALI